MKTATMAAAVAVALFAIGSLTLLAHLAVEAGAVILELFARMMEELT